MKPVWEVEGATMRFPGGGIALRDASLTVGTGEFVALVGPNGAGKSTLLRMLGGLLAPTEGRIRFGGRPITGWSRRELARSIGIVPQTEEHVFPMTVRDLVGMGRYPHLGPWQPEGEADRAAIGRALALTDTERLTGRVIDTLSGGERQRARIARALAQDGCALLLDEPTAALDVAHEMAIFGLVRALAREGRAVVLATHNVNLAARAAHRIVLLVEGAIVADGPPAQVMRAELLETAFGWPVRIVPHPGPGADEGAPQMIPLATADSGVVPDA